MASTRNYCHFLHGYPLVILSHGSANPKSIEQPGVFFTLCSCLFAAIDGLDAFPAGKAGVPASYVDLPGGIPSYRLAFNFPCHMLASSSFFDQRPAGSSSTPWKVHIADASGGSLSLYHADPLTFGDLHLCSSYGPTLAEPWCEWRTGMNVF